MQARVLFLVGAIALLVLQMTVAPLIEVAGVHPDLYVLFVVLLVGVLPPSTAMLAAFVLGIVRDFTIAGAPVGVDAFALLCAAGVLVFVHKHLLLESDWGQGAAALLGSTVHGAVWAITLTGSATAFARLFLLTAVPTALYTCLLMPLFARLALRLLNRPRRRRPVRSF